MPVSSAAAMAMLIGAPAWKSAPMTIAHSAIADPTDRSMPAVMMMSVMGSARIARSQRSDESAIWVCGRTKIGSVMPA